MFDKGFFGYYGLQCDQYECPCQNNGSCRANRCMCPSGFSGDFCEFKETFCNLTNCDMGECTDQKNPCDCKTYGYFKNLFIKFKDF